MTKHVCALVMGLSVLAMTLGQAEDQPPSGPPDMLALYLTRINGQSMTLTYPAQKQTYTLRLTPTTLFCKHGKREKSWAFLQEHMGKGKNVITVKTDPERKVALIVWNTGPSLVSRGTSPTDSTSHLEFPEVCVHQ